MKGAERKQVEGGWSTQDHKAFFAAGLLGHLLSWHHRSLQESITVHDHGALSPWRSCRCLCLVECTLGNSEETDGDNLQTYPWISEEGSNVCPGELWGVMRMSAHPSSVAPSHSVLPQVGCGPYLQCPNHCPCYVVIVQPCRLKMGRTVGDSLLDWLSSSKFLKSSSQKKPWSWARAQI